MPLTLDTNKRLERETLERFAGSPGFEDLTFASALEIRARDIMNETAIALSHAQSPATPPRAVLPKIPVRRTRKTCCHNADDFQKVHIASQGSPFRKPSTASLLASVNQRKSEVPNVRFPILVDLAEHRLIRKQSASSEQPQLEFQIPLNIASQTLLPVYDLTDSYNPCIKPWALV